MDTFTKMAMVAFYNVSNNDATYKIIHKNKGLSVVSEEAIAI